MIRVLLIEDNLADARLVSAILDKHSFEFSLCTCSTLESGMQELSSSGADIVLLDLTLPDSSGLETVTTLRSKFPKIPIIVYTVLNDDATGVEALKLGAQDYIAKDVLVSSGLAKTIKFALERSRLIKAEAALDTVNEDFSITMKKLQATIAEIKGIHKE